MTEEPPQGDHSQFPPPTPYQPPPYQMPGYPSAVPPPIPPSGYPYGEVPGEPPEKRKVWPWILGAGVLVVASIILSVYLAARSSDDWFIDDYYYEEDSGYYFDDPGYSSYGVPIPDEAPAPAAEDAAEITAAFEVAFNPESTTEEWLAAVNAPEETGLALRELEDGCGTAQVRLGMMYLMDSSNAAAEFRFTDSGIPAADGVVFMGTADLVDGKWMVSEYTIDKVIDLAEPFC